MPQQEKQNNSNSNDADNSCTMTGFGWDCRPLGPLNEAMSIVLAGQDVILAEDVGSPLQALKPLSGDFGVVARLINDAEQWLQNQSFNLPGLNQGISLWLEWRKHCFTHPIRLTEFLETHFGEEEVPGLSVR